MRAWNQDKNVDSKQGARVEKGLLLLKLYTPKGRFPNNKRQKAKQMDTKKAQGQCNEVERDSYKTNKGEAMMLRFDQEEKEAQTRKRKVSQHLECQDTRGTVT